MYYEEGSLHPYLGGGAEVSIVGFWNLPAIDRYWVKSGTHPQWERGRVSVCLCLGKVSSDPNPFMWVMVTWGPQLPHHRH